MAYRTFYLGSNKVRAQIRTGNTKLGPIPNFSLPPGVTCSAAARRTCFIDGCYAVNTQNQYKEARGAWHNNYKALKNDPRAVFEGIRAYLRKYKPLFFRLHVSGDFFAAWYLWEWMEIFREFPETCFLAFTKQFNIIRPSAQDLATTPNLHLYLSGWSGIKIPADLKKLFPVADCVTRDMLAPVDSFECGGSCETCSHCFTTRSNVYFHKH